MFHIVHSSTQEREESSKNNLKMCCSSMAHVLLLPYPSQGHINPMLQFAKRLSSKGPMATLVTTHFILNATKPHSTTTVSFEPISDGYDEGGVAASSSLDAYLTSLETFGSRTLAELILVRKDTSDRPFTCVVFDTYVPWALAVAKSAGLKAVPFSTQSAAASALYCYVNRGLMDVPDEDGGVSDPMFGLPPMSRSEFPSMTIRDGSYPTLSRLSLSQFEEIEAADWVLFNTFQDLEEEVISGLKLRWNAIPVGPTIPSMLVDKLISGDESYGVNLLTADNDSCMKWLSKREPNSVIYISFGSFASLDESQMEEMAYGLKQSNRHFLWVVRSSEQTKLPVNFASDTAEVGLVVPWCPQLEVLSHPSVGVFITHCGWNSTVEGLSLGVPMVAVPQWTDQPTNAKFVEEVWGVGVRARVDESKGLVGRDEIERCVEVVMGEGERGVEIKMNALRWKDLVRDALSEGGTSDKNLDLFVEFLNGEWRC